MKNFVALTVLFGLSIAASSVAAEIFVGKIIATDAAAKNQTDTATPFTIHNGDWVYVTCDNPAYLRWFSASTSAVTATTYSHKLSKDQPLLTSAGTALGAVSGSGFIYLSVLGVTASTTVTCYVSRVDL